MPEISLSASGGSTYGTPPGIMMFGGMMAIIFGDQEESKPLLISGVFSTVLGTFCLAFYIICPMCTYEFIRIEAALCTEKLKETDRTFQQRLEEYDSNQAMKV